MADGNGPCRVVGGLSELATGCGQSLRTGDVEHKRSLYGRRESDIEFLERDDLASQQRPLAGDGTSTRWCHQHDGPMSRGTPDQWAAVLLERCDRQAEWCQGDGRRAGSVVDEFEREAAVPKLGVVYASRVLGGLDPGRTRQRSQTGDFADKVKVVLTGDRLPGAGGPVVRLVVINGPNPNRADDR